MSAKQLIAGLKFVGANFFPEPDANRYVSITKKRFLAEASVYRSMALACCGYGFQWSHWNGEVAPGNIVVQVAEGIRDEEEVRREGASQREGGREGGRERGGRGGGRCFGNGKWFQKEGGGGGGGGGGKWFIQAL